MPREVFPYESDRAAIDWFLTGHKAGYSTDWVEYKAGKLSVRGSVVAWYDTAGALTISLAGEAAQVPGRAINYIVERLGLTDSELHYEWREGDSGPQWFRGDAPISTNEPVTLCGPMSIQAFRAAEKHKPKDAT